MLIRQKISLFILPISHRTKLDKLENLLVVPCHRLCRKRIAPLIINIRIIGANAIGAHTLHTKFKRRLRYFSYIYVPSLNTTFYYVNNFFLMFSCHFFITQYVYRRQTVCRLLQCFRHLCMHSSLLFRFLLW